MENRHKDVPTEEWIDVPAGMLVVQGTYVDKEGVLRSQSDDSCVVWHLKGCKRKGIHPSEIVYDDETEAPWCPVCWQKRRVQKVFGIGYYAKHM